MGRDNDPVNTNRFQVALPRRLCVLAMLLTAGILAAGPAVAGSLRCGSRLVDENALAAELLAACGEPSLRDQWSYQLPQGGYVADTEVWVYDLGPSQLLRLVKLRNGRIVEVETDGYGFPADAPRRCEPRALTEGLSKYRLLRRCGEPLTRRSENVLRPLYNRPEIYRHNSDPYAYRNQYVTPAYREEWVYNFGARAAMRLVVLEDGWVTYVEQLDRGFDPR